MLAQERSMQKSSEMYITMLQGPLRAASHNESVLLARGLPVADDHSRLFRQGVKSNLEVGRDRVR